MEGLEALKARARLYPLNLAMLVAAILLGALTPAPHDLLEETYTKYKELIASLGLEESPFDVAVYRVFVHNLYAASTMYVPILGIGFALYAAYVTGLAVQALAVMEAKSLWVIMASLLLVPSTWIEVLAYSIAVTESMFLGRAIMKRGRRGEFTISLAMLILVASLLLLSASIELMIARLAFRGWSGA